MGGRGCKQGMGKTAAAKKSEMIRMVRSRDPRALQETGEAVGQVGKAGWAVWLSGLQSGQAKKRNKIGTIFDANAERQGFNHSQNADLWRVDHRSCLLGPQGCAAVFQWSFGHYYWSGRLCADSGCCRVVRLCNFMEGLRADEVELSKSRRI
ncbi:uncharacterized protein MCYG_03263 [Microsporum canis CBS 113480]|uniref:Uncharacterized protein n=1 Tax=Arthroderma otae (strain ATCC MYA-4605 / CBS 113480) TaxID=554155 RepID=C5FL72_ARTOC|nr:uncharacterized protein MCYG_03263 [Microsporum canis CBS 113480]EEQ30444.1 predicted protein [Microsporum canis CBS 113480]